MFSCYRKHHPKQENCQSKCASSYKLHLY